MAQNICFGIGSTVMLTGLSKRPELNRQTGRVLRYLPKSCRYSICLTSERVSAKPANLHLMSSRSPEQSSSLLSLLPDDQLLKLLVQLPVRRLLAASATCICLQQLFKAHEPQLWRPLLRSRALSPYHDETLHGSAAYRTARESRRQWHSGGLMMSNSTPDSGILAGSRRPCLLAFSMFVRSVDVDFERRVVGVGLSDGSVQVCQWDQNPSAHVYEVEQRFQGEVHTGQVLAVALDCAAGVLVSGCGIPPYPNRLSGSAPHSAACVKVWGLASGGMSEGSDCSGHLQHTLLHGHTDSVNSLQMLDDTEREPRILGDTPGCVRMVASGSSDSTVIVWDLKQAKAQQTLKGHTGAVTALATNGIHLFSASTDGTVREWNWRSGECCRVLIESGCSLSALSVHRGTVAIGTSEGLVRLYLDGGGRECTQLTEVVAAESEDPDEQVAVPSIQHDGDKIVYVSRTGKLAVLALAPQAHSGHQGSSDGADPSVVDHTDTVNDGAEMEEALWGLVPGQDSPCAQQGNTSIEAVMTCCNYDLRMFCSSVRYQGGVLVHDGLDDIVAIFS